jgi:hypothetical protein
MPERHGEVAVLLVAAADRLAQDAGRPRPAGAGVLVGVAGAEGQQQVTACLGVGDEPLKQGVVGDVQRRHDQHGKRSKGCAGWTTASCAPASKKPW